MRSVVYQDFRANLEGDGPEIGLAVSLRTVLTIRFLATSMFRLSALAGKRSGVTGSIVKQVNHLLTGADIAWQARIGPGLVMFHPTGVVVGPYASIGERCTLQQGVTIGGNGGPDAGRFSSPTIGDGVFVGAGARIIGKLEIGDGVIVGANAVVTHDVPEFHIAIGVPARAVRRSADRPGLNAT